MWRRCFQWLGITAFLYHTVQLLLLTILDGDLGVIFAEFFGKSTASLKGKVIWITGASSGIGEKLALECAKFGIKLVLSARRVTELERVKSECLHANTKLSENDILIVPMDIIDMDSHQKLFNDVIKHFGSLDILVNNAGRSQRALWENIDSKVDQEIFELNVFGLVNLTRVAVKYFLKKGSGHVAVTSSLAGVIGAPFSGSYTGTKHAIHGYYNSLRIEKQSKNLSVTIFCPGPTFSNFLEESFTETPGQQFGSKVQANDRRMTGERCAELFAVALANKLDEAWVALPPIMALIYYGVYFPNLRKIALNVLGPGKLLKLRDSGNSMKTE